MGIDDPDEEQERSSTPELLAQLLSSLAAGAHAVQGLPINNEEDDDNEFDFQKSLPEFSRLVDESQDSLLSTIIPILEDFCTEDVVNYERNANDPLLWDACADACDVLIEQVEAFLSSETTIEDMQSETSVNLSNWSTTARKRAQSSFGQLLDGIVDMPKPQEVHQIRLPVPLNDRTTPFVPPISEKHNANVAPLDLSLSPGHGLETRFGKMRTVLIPSSVVAPAHHVGHVYQAELDQLAFPTWQTDQSNDRAKPDPIPIVEKLEARWVSSPEELNELASILENVKHIAVDLEAHSYHTFAGLTCLIQISVFESEITGAEASSDDSGRIRSFLIDPFSLWSHLSSSLGPSFSNPNIVKILHGADSDVQWLQRDFGLFIVNLFDTGRAARALKLNSAGYAHLLQKYAKVTADKTHQLADWRQRPLPDAMRHYAIMDTHYLLDIYRHLRHDICVHKEVTLEEVLEQSRLVSLIRYAPEPFKPDGYMPLIQKRVNWVKSRSKSAKNDRTRSELNDLQEAVLRELYDWRDATARRHDESTHFVCPNQSLVRLALACPTSLSVLQGLFNPVPPLVLSKAKDIISIITRVQSQQNSNKESAKSTSGVQNLRSSPISTTKNAGIPSSAFFKPAQSPTDDFEPRDRLLSPVLGTEALYMQAGWMTPQNPDGPDYNDHVDVVMTTTDEEDKDEEGSPGKTNKKPRNVLAVHQANQNYGTSQFASHSLQMGREDNSNLRASKGGEGFRERSVDGMGAARTARTHSQSPMDTGTSSVEEDAEVAQQTAAHIRNKLSRDEQFMGLVSPTTELDDEDVGDAGDGRDETEGQGSKVDSQGGDDANAEEGLIIPRSMREIYKISNRNRRNKKTSYPVSERSGTPTNDKEAEALTKAEEVLKSRGSEGKNYFDEISATPKRQRTKSVGTASLSSDDAPMNEAGSISREDDIGLMQEIGWIKDKAEIDGMLNQRQSADGDEVPEQGDDESDEEVARGATLNKSGKSSFEYSSIGPVGVFNSGAMSAPNPFFSGAGNSNPTNSNSQTGKADKKKNTGRGKSSRRQVERPEKKDSRSQVFKKR